MRGSANWRNTPLRRKLIVATAGTVALIVLIGIACFAGCSRDEEAYRDGQQTAWEAEMLLKVMREPPVVEGADDTPEKACLKVYRTSRSEVRKMDQDDWVQGCVDQIEQHPGAVPWKSKTRTTPLPTTATYNSPTSAPAYTPTPTNPPTATEDEFASTNRVILRAQVGDCLQVIEGKKRGDGTSDTYIYAAGCDSPLATSRVVSIAFGKPTCTPWVRTPAVQPPKVLCLQKLR